VIELDDVAGLGGGRTGPTSRPMHSDRSTAVGRRPDGDAGRAACDDVRCALGHGDLHGPDRVGTGRGSQTQNESLTQLGLAMLAAILIVFVIMVATFKSLLQPLILLVSIPFAATGSIALSLLTDTPLGLTSMIGLLMLIGIVVTNAI